MIPTGFSDYPSISNLYLPVAGHDVSNPDGRGNTADVSNEKESGKSSSEGCETCKARKYQDGSNENVSFKSAAHISPNAAASAVRAHESEHVSNAYTRAAKLDGKVVSASVAIHTSICPECGRTYVSGGTTNTTVKYPNESNPYQQSRKSQDSLRFAGANIDYVA